MEPILEPGSQMQPGVVPAATDVTQLIIRLASRFQVAYAGSLGPLGLKEVDYGVLAPIRRAGATRGLTPTYLAKHCMLTSGGMTAALDRLERKGLIARIPNPKDRRGTLVQLTDAGREVIDEAMMLRTRTDHRLVSGLDEHERDQLGVLLRDLMRGGSHDIHGVPEPLHTDS